LLNIGIIGATGYAGAELLRILSRHKKINISVITSRQYAGVMFDKVYPCMKGIIDLPCEEYSSDLYDKADLFFLALPHKLPMAIAPNLLDAGKKVIDLSADFRFSNPEIYEKYYQPHTAKNILSKSVYGLSEIYRDKIKNATIVGNPGCYPTSALLPLLPLIKTDFIDSKSIIIDSKSGVSGAGRSLSLKTHYCEVNESFKAYKVAQHRHNPEIEEVLSAELEKKIKITFVPHLVPMSQGMETTIYLNLNKKIKRSDIIKLFKNHYLNEYFIRIKKDEPPDTIHVKGTNFCDIGAVIDERNNRLILLSVIDNLIKGAAGQAVQNMNIMCGFKETEGLL
jgi:N-acetyl-gamma-glutamyl-phosphate reductase